jgi:hypothetical protein
MINIFYQRAFVGYVSVNIPQSTDVEHKGLMLLQECCKLNFGIGDVQNYVYVKNCKPYGYTVYLSKFCTMNVTSAYLE